MICHPQLFIVFLQWINSSQKHTSNFIVFIIIIFPVSLICLRHCTRPVNSLLSVSHPNCIERNSYLLQPPGRKSRESGPGLNYKSSRALEKVKFSTPAGVLYQDYGPDWERVGPWDIKQGHLDQCNKKIFLSCHIPLNSLSLQNMTHFSMLEANARDFLGGPVAKTLCSQCRGSGFDPWSGNEIPHATTTNLTCCNDDWRSHVL